MANKVNSTLIDNMYTMKQYVFFLLVFGTIFSLPQFISGCTGAYNGEKLFFSEGCSQCHTFKGRGGSLAPDLSAVTNIRSDSWIESYLQAPKKMNPAARMPAFKHLSRSKLKAIIAYLKN
jgi:cbb3-type cytochrome oxidase cytochrome c subunit